jgi:hypothetical protein
MRLEDLIRPFRLMSPDEKRTIVSNMRIRRSIIQTKKQDKEKIERKRENKPKIKKLEEALSKLTPEQIKELKEMMNEE